MATATAESALTTGTPTLQDLMDRLGGIPLSRVLARPAPGSATEADLLEVNRGNEHLCERVDSMLVEKGLEFRGSILTEVIIGLLRSFAVPRNLGLVTTPDGLIKLFPDTLRAPDIAFISWRVCRAFGCRRRRCPSLRRTWRSRSYE